MQLLPKPARPSRAHPDAAPPELDWPAPAPEAAAARGSGDAGGGGALGWVSSGLRSVAGAVGGGIGGAGGGGGGGGVRFQRGAGAAIEWGAAPAGGGRAEAPASEAAGAADEERAAGGDGGSGAEWAATSPSAEAARASRAYDLALKKVLEWLTPFSIAASACGALLGLAGIFAPWYGRSVPGEDACEIWYSQVSYGWEGGCSAATRAENPQFGAFNSLALDATGAQLAAGCISAAGVACALAAVTAAALQRAAARRLGSPRYQPPARCGTACALVAAASLELALTTLGAVMAGANFEALVNTNALVAIDTFGGGRSVADAAIAVAAVAVVLAVLIKLRLRKHAKEAKLADRRRAEQLLGLPAFGTHPCC